MREGSAASVGIITRKRTFDLEGERRGAGSEMRVALAGAGVTPVELAHTMRLGLRASKRNAAGRRLPDWGTRLRYLELAHRLRGDLVAEKAGSGETVTYEQRLLQVLDRGKT